MNLKPNEKVEWWWGAINLNGDVVAYKLLSNDMETSITTGKILKVCEPFVVSKNRKKKKELAVRIARRKFNLSNTQTQ